MVEEFPLPDKFSQSEVIEVFVGDEEVVVKFADLVKQGGVFPFELEQFLICEEVGRVREFLHLLVEYLHLFRAFLGFRFQAFLFSDSEESSDSCDEDDDGYGNGYDMHDMVFCVCHPFG